MKRQSNLMSYFNFPKRSKEVPEENEPAESSSDSSIDLSGNNGDLLSCTFIHAEQTDISVLFLWHCRACEMQDSDILMVMSQVVTSAMLDNCLSELPIIYIERDLSHKPWDNLDQIIDRFAKNGHIIMYANYTCCYFVLLIHTHHKCNVGAFLRSTDTHHFVCLTAI